MASAVSGGYRGGVGRTKAIVRQLDRPPDRRPAPARLVEAFLAGRRGTTLRAYSQDLADFRGFVGARDVDEAIAALLGQGPGPANETVLGYRTHLQGRGLAPATINRRLAALRSMLKLGRTLGMVNWSLEVSNIRSEPYRDTRGPGLDGFLAMLASVKGRTPKACRDRAILRLLFDLALRRDELLSLDMADVDLKAATISVLGKGRSERQLLSLPAETARALAAWLRVHPVRAGGSVAVFVNFDHAQQGNGRLTGSAVYQIVRACGERVGLKVRPHGLRHAGITLAIEAAKRHGIGVEEVMDYSRHKNVATLLLYRDRGRNVQGQLAGLVAGATRKGRRGRRRQAQKPPSKQ